MPQDWHEHSPSKTVRPPPFKRPHMTILGVFYNTARIKERRVREYSTLVKQVEEALKDPRACRDLCAKLLDSPVFSKLHCDVVALEAFDKEGNFQFRACCCGCTC